MLDFTTNSDYFHGLKYSQTALDNNKVSSLFSDFSPVIALN